MGMIKIEGTPRQLARSRTIPVTQALPGQVLNSTGGYAWEVDDWDRLNRFLILGVEGGTYYVKEPDLLKSSHEAVVRCIQKDGLRTVHDIVEVSTNGRAYRNDPAIYALALCTANGDGTTKAAAYHALSFVCRTGTHLYHFAQYCDALRGWGRGLKRAVGLWFTDKEPAKLAYQMIKYQQRDGWSAKDLLRKTHPVAVSPMQEAVFRWVTAGMDGLGERTVKRIRNGQESVQAYGSFRNALPLLIQVFEQAKTADESVLVKLILEHSLPREAIPTEKLNSIKVWDALLEKMPLTAMIRNLGKMTSLGLVKPLSQATALVCKRLRDTAYLKKSRIHPLAVLAALKVYAQNQGMKGSLSWKNVPAVLSALDEAFYLSFGNVVPAGKPLLIGLDVSGSMGAQIAGSVVTSAEAVAAMSLVWVATEPEVHVFGFADTFRELSVRKNASLAEVLRDTNNCNFGATNISLAYEYALQNQLQVGGFIVMSDNEANGGPHASLRLKHYREQFNPAVRSVVVNTTSTSFTVNDPNDKFGLDVCGFDTSVPNLVTDFIRDTKVAAPEAVDTED